MEPFHVDKLTDVQSLCQQSDIVSLHAAVAPGSRNMIGPAEFAAMPDDGYFVNTARAALIEDGALVEALAADEIQGAALDVYPEEPIAEDDPLLEMANVVTTPHIASASQDVIDRHSELTVNDIETLVNGEQPMHVANPETLTDFTLGEMA
ncbi:MAG: D-isomer specific 2-hydroxyacid dehydrogenase, NAD binding domain protein [Halonotius sp. J07HN4]|jgi:Lactate dehydrogenase and related dehydrogenases|nr:MAG: D-isomer specific 2-hydroxyacid dehydrogenase, NAD binding domain protein [Halonotius sp. J07HN4]